MNADILYPLQLLDVRLYEANLKRIAREDAEGEDKPESEPEPTPHLQIKVEIFQHSEARNVSAHLTIETEGPHSEAPDFHLSFTLEGLFESQIDLAEIGEEAWAEFENTSSITLLWPYAREMLSSFSRRMRVDLPILPTLNRLAMQQPEEA